MQGVLLKKELMGVGDASLIVHHFRSLLSSDHISESRAVGSKDFRSLDEGCHAR